MTTPITNNQELREEIDLCVGEAVLNAISRPKQAHISHEEYVDNIMSLITQRQLDVLERVEDSVIGSDYEQNIYRDDDGSLMCSTCKDEVFGGMCECTSNNERLAEQRKALATIRQEISK